MPQKNRIVKWTCYPELNETRVLLYPGDKPSKDWKPEDQQMSQIVKLPEAYLSISGIRIYLERLGFIL